MKSHINGNLKLEELILTSQNKLLTSEDINKKSSNIISAKFFKVNLEKFDFESRNNYEYYYNIHKLFDCNKKYKEIIDENYILKEFFLIRNKSDYVNILESPSSIKAIKKLNYSIKDLIKIPFDKFTTVNKVYAKKGKDSIKKAYINYDKLRLERIMECKFERRNVIEFEGYEDSIDKDDEPNNFFKRMFNIVDEYKMDESSINYNDKIFNGVRIRKSLNFMNVINNMNKYNDYISLKNLLSSKNSSDEFKNEHFDKNLKDNNHFIHTPDKINKNKNEIISKTKVNTRSIEENLFFKEKIKYKNEKKDNFYINQKDLGNVTKYHLMSSNFIDSNDDFSPQLSNSTQENHLSESVKSYDSNSKKQLPSTYHLDKQKFIFKKISANTKEIILDKDNPIFDRMNDEDLKINILKEKLQNLEKEQIKIDKMKENTEEKKNYLYTR